MTKQDVAVKILKKLKARWGLTWEEMGQCFGVRGNSLSVFCSNVGPNSVQPSMSEELADIIIDFSAESDPPLEFPDKRRKGEKIIVLARGKVYSIPVPDLGWCPICGRPFIPRGYGQRYCTGKRGKCGLAARRERRTHG